MHALASFPRLLGQYFYRYLASIRLRSLHSYRDVSIAVGKFCLTVYYLVQ